MFKKIEINNVHTKVDKETKDFINNKIGKLDTYVSSHSRESAHVEVFIKEANSSKKTYICEVWIHLPHQDIFVKENGQTIFSAVDVCENRLKIQLKKYKDKNETGKYKRRLFARFSKKVG